MTSGDALLGRESLPPSPLLSQKSPRLLILQYFPLPFLKLCLWTLGVNLYLKLIPSGLSSLSPVVKTPPTFVQLWLLSPGLLSASEFRPLNRPHERSDLLRTWAHSRSQGMFLPLSPWVPFPFEPGVLNSVPCLTGANHGLSTDHWPIFNSVKGTCFSPRLHIPFTSWFSDILEFNHYSFVFTVDLRYYSKQTSFPTREENAIHAL